METIENLQEITYIPSIEIEGQVSGSTFFWPSRDLTNAADFIKVQSRSMVSVYYEKTGREMKVPVQTEFAEEFLKVNHASLMFLKNNSRELQKAMFYRACRAWGTLVAEHHLYALLVESGKYVCKKSVLEDINGQADIIVKNGLGRFLLDVHTGTKLSDYWRTKKIKRHQKQNKLPVLELKLIGVSYAKQVFSHDRKARIHLFLPEVVQLIEKWRRDTTMPEIFVSRITQDAICKY